MCEIGLFIYEASGSSSALRCVRFGVGAGKERIGTTRLDQAGSVHLFGYGKDKAVGFVIQLSRL